MENGIRRDLKFEHLDDAVSECERLLRTGYVRNGNWTLAQICRHIRTTIEANLSGYPTWMSVLGYPLRPFLRWFLLPGLLSGKSPAGIRTAPMFVPPEKLDDTDEVNAFADCVARFEAHDGPLYAHPGFGKMNRSQFGRFHAAHAAHHLSFLDTAAKTDD